MKTNGLGSGSGGACPKWNFTVRIRKGLALVEFLKAMLVLGPSFLPSGASGASDDPPPVVHFQGPRVMHLSYTSDWSQLPISPRPIGVALELIRPDGAIETLMAGTSKIGSTNRVGLHASGRYELRRSVTFPGKPTNTVQRTSYLIWEADFTRPTGITGRPWFDETFSAEKVSHVDVDLPDRIRLSLDGLVVAGPVRVGSQESMAGTFELSGCNFLDTVSVFARIVRVEDCRAASSLGVAGRERAVLRLVNAVGAMGAGGSSNNVVLVESVSANTLDLYGGMVSAERVMITNALVVAGRTLSLKNSRLDGTRNCRLEAEEVLQVSDNDFYGWGGVIRMQAPPGGLYVLNNVFLATAHYEWPTLSGNETLSIGGNSFWNPAALGIHRVADDFALPGAYTLNGNFWGDPAGPAGDMPPGGDWLGSAGGGCAQLARNTTWLPTGRTAASGLGARLQPEVVWLRNVAAGQNVIAPGYEAFGRQDRRTLVSFDLRTLMGEVPSDGFYLEATGDDGVVERVPARPRGAPLRRYETDPGVVRPLDFIVPPRPGFRVNYVLHQRVDGGVDRVIYRGSYTQTPGPARPLRIGLKQVTINARGYNREFNEAPRPEQDPVSVIHDRLTTAMAALLPLRKREDIRIEVLPSTEYSPLVTGILGLRHNSIYFAVARELQRQLDTENAVRTAAGRPRLDLMLGVVPRSCLSENTGSTGFNHGWYPNVAVIEETEPEAAVHEFGHAFGLYGREQYALPDGWNLALPCNDAGGFDYCDIFVENTAGARFWGASLFVPDEDLTYTPIPGGIRHAPAGVVSGVRDIMGAKAAEVILPSTHFAFTAALTQRLGWQMGPGAAPVPAVPAADASRRDVRLMGAPAAATRRIALEGLVISRTNPATAGGTLLRILPETLVARNLPSSLPAQFGAARLYMRLFALDDAGRSLGQWDCRRSEDGDLSSAPVRWYQTFDVPTAATLLRLETSTTGTILEDLRALPGDWLPHLAVTAGVDPATKRIGPFVDLDFGVVEDAMAPRRLGLSLLASVDGGTQWVHQATYDGASGARLARGGLPVSDQLLLKLVASDGFVERESVVGPFRNRAPEATVTILQPWPGAAAPTTTPWVLSSAVASSEAPAWVRWTSSRDGALGEGLRLGDVRLTPGAHRLVCTAAETNGRIASNAVDVVVLREGETPIDLRIAEDALSWSVADWDRARGRPERPQTGRECEAVVAVHNPGATNTLRLQLFLSAPGSGEYLLGEGTVTNGPLETATMAGRFIPTSRGVHRLRARVELLGLETPGDPARATHERTWSFTNQPPVARGLNAVVSAGQEVGIGLGGTDVDGDPLVAEVLEGPAHGVLSGTPPELQYRPAPGFVGADGLVFRISDGAAWSVPITLPIRVRGSAPELPGEFLVLGRANQPLVAQVPAEGLELGFLAPMLTFMYGGLKLDARTGAISGTVAAASTNWVPVTVTNRYGRAQGQMKIVILAHAAPPEITSAGEAAGRAGSGFGYQIVAINAPERYLANQLPAGLALNPYTGEIGGTPLNAGVYSATVGASNAFGIGWKPLVITVATSGEPPRFTRLLDAFGMLGAPMSLALVEVCANNPVEWQFTGLPPGVTGASESGLISGTPRAAGHFAPSVTVRNAAGSTSTTFSLVVETPVGVPVVVGGNELSGTVGSDFRWTIRASESPTRFAAEGLPPGLGVEVLTGLVSGRPTVAGSYTVRMAAANSRGEGATLVPFLILPNPLGPLLSDAVFADARLGGSIDFLPVALNRPTRFWAEQLPPGVSIHPSDGHLTGRFEGVGRFVSTLWASNAVGRVSARLYFTIAPEFAGWARVAGLTGPDAEAGADPDGDGRSNLVEYALGGDPSRSMEDAPLRLRQQPDGTGVVLYFRVWTPGTGNLLSLYEAGGVRYEIEVAPALDGPWGPDPDAFDPSFRATAQGDGRDLLAVPVLNRTANAARFFRVRVRAN